MANDTEGSKNPATVRETAPATATTPQIVMPRNKRTGNFAAGGYPMARKYPEVRGGVCEFCGVLDPNQPSQYQYKLCPHYRGMQLSCDYCGHKRDGDEVAYHSTLLVHDHPYNPDLLVVRCNSYDCAKAHEERFKVGA